MPRGGNSRNKIWRPEDLARARELKDAGLSYEEIGKALGNRTGRAVLDAIRRHSEAYTTERHLNYWDGPAIGYCPTAARLRSNAIQGSARLLAEIERVFGQQRMAA
jgi:hypothetical protein